MKYIRKVFKKYKLSDRTKKGVFFRATVPLTLHCATAHTLILPVDSWYFEVELPWNNLLGKDSRYWSQKEGIQFSQNGSVRHCLELSPLILNRWRIKPISAEIDFLN